jgi:hypothetical protein
VVLETTVLHWESPEAELGTTVPLRERPEVTLVQFGILWEHPSKKWDSPRNLLG